MKTSETIKNSKYKYPHTLHLPWSPGVHRDDRVMISTVHLDGEEVVVTEKMDGENTTIYHDGIYHARSIDSGSSLWRTRIAALAAELGHVIQPGERVCGENMYAEHSIRYEDLPSVFLVFSMWTLNYCQSWDDTYDWAVKNGLFTVPVICVGKFDRDSITEAYEFYKKKLDRPSEGYVVRVRRGFLVNGFEDYVGKYVREKHVQTDDFWTKNWKPNGFRRDE